MTIMSEMIKTIKIKNHVEIQELKGAISNMKHVWGLTHGELRMTGKNGPLKIQIHRNYPVWKMEKLFLKNEVSQIYETISNDNIHVIGILKKRMLTEEIF